MAKKNENTIEREYEAKGISAHPDWWQEVETAASQMGLNRSAFIRMAVNDFLKGKRADISRSRAVIAS